MVFNKIFRPVKEICTCTDNSPKWPHHVFPIRFLTDSEDSEDSHVRSSNLFFLVSRLGSYSEKSYVKGSIFGGLFGFPENCVIICFPGSYCHAIVNFPNRITLAIRRMFANLLRLALPKHFFLSRGNHEVPIWSQI